MKYISGYNKFVNELVTPIEVLKGDQYFQTKVKIDPALITFDEYIKIVNDEGKWHDDHWDYDVKSLSYNNHFDDKKLLVRKKVGNLDIEFYESTRKLVYSKYDYEKKETLRDEKGEIIYFTEEELKSKGVPTIDITIYAFHNKKCVGFISDEWGATLVALAREYRGSGIGVMLTTMFRKKHPDRASGGFTESGWKNLKKVQRNFIKEYLRNGVYSYLMRKGEITKERVMQILKSVGYTGKELNTVSKFAQYYSKDDSYENLLIWRYNDDSFIILDKNILACYQDPNCNHFIDMFIKAHVFLRWNEEIGNYDLYTSYGRTKKLEWIALKCAMSAIKIENNEGITTRFYKNLSTQTKSILEELKNNKEMCSVKPAKTWYNDFDIIKLKKPLVNIEIFKPAKYWLKQNDNRHQELENFLAELAFQTSQQVEEPVKEGYQDIDMDYIINKLPKLQDLPKNLDRKRFSNFTLVYFPPTEYMTKINMLGDIKAYDNIDGTEIGNCSFGYNSDLDKKLNRMEGAIDVRPDWRRKGVGTEMYKYAEEMLGNTLYPAINHSDSANKFWNQPNRPFGKY